MNKGTASDRKLLFASVASIRKTKLAQKARTCKKILGNIEIEVSVNYDSNT